MNDPDLDLNLNQLGTSPTPRYFAVGPTPRSVIIMRGFSNSRLKFQRDWPTMPASVFPSERMLPWPPINAQAT
ncbi:MAG: hypothetical protein GX803_01065 [Lentisphaerae bacterium]|jgi:hypothetical protein|nr:hypothetical protein [Lentisphaerota bacterium]